MIELCNKLLANEIIAPLSQINRKLLLFIYFQVWNLNLN